MEQMCLVIKAWVVTNPVQDQDLLPFEVAQSDFSLRAGKAGFKVAMVPSAYVHINMTESSKVRTCKCLLAAHP